MAWSIDEDHLNYLGNTGIKITRIKIKKQGEACQKKKQTRETSKLELTSEETYSRVNNLHA